MSPDRRNLSADDRRVLGEQLAKLKPGEQLHVPNREHLFLFMLTNQSGFHTGRPRFLVACTTCEVLLHEATTGPDCRMEQHLFNVARIPA